MGRATLLLAAAALLIAVAHAWAARDGDGDLIATFDGNLHPNSLPRNQSAPVAIRVAGNVRSASGDMDRLPQLERITVGINRAGRLFDRGLPVCHAEEIQPAREREARHICGDALVGRGHVTVQVRIPGQLTFPVKAKLLAFNGPRQGGQKLILAQAYASEPPGSFILTFSVDRRGGTFGTVLTTVLPAETREWAYLTHFDITLHRLYSYRGKRRSYISAACKAPSGFRSVPFPFARATYSFANGQRLSMSESETCRVAGK